MKAWRKQGKECVAFTIEKHGKLHLHVPCGKKVVKQWLCAEHYEQGKQLAAMRARFNDVNYARRLKNQLQRELGFGGRQWKKLKKLRQRRGRAALAATKAANQATTVDATYG